jgi:putative DNA primase/helicase
VDQLPIEKVLGVLEGVKQTGRNTWKAKCPAHDDKNPSLKVTRADDDAVLTHCYTGCSFDDVVNATPLSKSDFFPPKPGSYSNGRQNENLGPVRAKVPRKVIQYYEYVTEAGSPVYRVLRYEPKGFSQERLSGGKWIAGLEGITRVPYHADEIWNAKPDEWIFVCEGEKDADSVQDQGLVGTTFMGGAGRSPQPEELQHFNGRRVAVLYDNDGPGRDRATALLGAFTGIAKDVRVVDLPSLPPKGDVTDWFGLGNTGADLLKLANTPPSIQSLVPEAVIRRAEDVVATRVHWLWHGWLARGKIQTLEGDPGMGKSTLTVEIAAKMTRGYALPGGIKQEPINVLFMSAEDGVEDTIKPRLEEAGADMSRVSFLDGKLCDFGVDLVTIPADLPLLKRVIVAANIGLVIIDPLSAYWSDSVNENKNQDVRRALAPLMSIMEETGASCILLRHMTKAQASSPIYRGAGSISIGGAARIVMMVGVDPDDEDVRILACVKTNLAIQPASLAYRLVSSPKNMDVAVIEWVGASGHSARDLQSADTGDLGPSVSEAVEWLKHYFRGGAIIMVKQMEKDAVAAGISLATLKRARPKAGVESKRDSSGVYGAWIPDTAGGSATGGSATGLGVFSTRFADPPEPPEKSTQTQQNTHIYIETPADPPVELAQPGSGGSGGSARSGSAVSQQEEEELPW